MTIQELIKRAGAQSKPPADQSIGEALMLIVSECGKAAEAVGQTAKKEDVHILRIGDMAENINDWMWAQTYKNCLLNTFESCMAGIVIQIASLIDEIGLHISDINLRQDIDSLYDTGATRAYESTGSLLLEVVKDLLDPGYSMDLRAWEAILSVGYLAECQGIDLAKHIELKLAYNEAVNKQNKA